MRTQHLICLAAFALAACQPAAYKPQPLTDAKIDKRIEEILPQLTLDEKVAMCHAQSKFSTPGVARLGIPELWWSDGPHGVRGEINWDDWGYANWTNDSITAFPALTALAATFNPELASPYGEAIAEEALYRGKDVILGPGVNIYRTPLNGRNFEYMGEDPFLASQMCVPYIKGMQSKGVAVSVKHFALNNQEIDRGHINVKVDERTLHEIYLPAFRAAVVDGGAWTLMGAYNQYLEQHCCHNQVLLNDILKRDWNFDGVVVSDWGGVHNTKQAVEYGMDVEMGTWTNGLTASQKSAYDNYYLAQPFLNGIRQGEYTEEQLNDKVRRILRLMFRTNMNPARGRGCLNTPSHSAAAHAVAAEAIVLLKNDDNLLPIKSQEPITIAVIGENATRAMAPSGGSSELKAKYEISPLDGIRKNFPNAKIISTLGYAGGPSAYGMVFKSRLNADSLVSEAVSAAKAADYVVFVGGLNKNHEQDCEGGDRKSYNLPYGQDELIQQLAAVNPNIAVLLVSGNAVAMPWIDSVKSVAQLWYLGNETGNAVGEVLAGKVNPSGKLPFSFPIRLEDCGAHSFGEAIVYPGDGKDVEYREGMYVGYRWHDSKDVKPLFAFGHGLSYTTFDISEYGVDKTTFTPSETITLRANIKNTGACAGAEVLQVYVGKAESAVERVKKELKGFAKTYLEAGESRNVEIKIPVESLAFYNVDTHSWQVEKGTYQIYLGTASDQVLEAINVEVK